MLAIQSIHRLLGVALGALGVLGITASFGLLATARPAVAAEKTADLAKYCREHVGRTAVPSIDRRDNGLMCSQPTSGGLGRLHRKIAEADVCAAQYRTQRYRRRGKDLICITGSGGATQAAVTIDLNKHCRARYGANAFVTKRRSDGRPMCTIRTNRGRGLRYHVIDVAGLCGGGSPRVAGNKLHCARLATGGGPAGGGGPPGGSAGNPGAAPANQGPLPAPRRKAGGKLTKADFTGCSTDKAIVRRKVPMPGWLTRPGMAFLYGAVPTPCPGLAGGRTVDLVEYCQKIRNKGVVFLGGRVPTCFGPPGKVSDRPYPTRAEWKVWLRRPGRSNWGRPIVLLSPCGWAGGMTTVAKSKAFSTVFKYANRRLECFYFKRARYMAILKRGKGGTAAEGSGGKPTGTKITKEY